jgi:hypothetical protein
MIVLYIRLENRFAAVGRNWLPFLLPIFLTAFVYAARALRLRRVGMTCGALGLIGLLLYDGIGGYHALKTIEHRYYEHARLNARPETTGLCAEAP